MTMKRAVRSPIRLFWARWKKFLVSYGFIEILGFNLVVLGTKLRGKELGKTLPAAAPGTKK